MKSVTAPAEQRVVLERVSWSTFLALLADVDNRRGRMAYDQGVLELMSPPSGTRTRRACSPGCWRPPPRRWTSRS